MPPIHPKDEAVASSLGAHTLKLSATQPQEDTYIAVVTPYDLAAAKINAPGGFHARVPVARRVLIAVDDSAPSCHAVTWSLENIARPGDLFMLVHVVGAEETAAPDAFIDEATSHSSPPSSPHGPLVSLPPTSLLKRLDIPAYVPQTDPAMVAALTQDAIRRSEKSLLALAKQCADAGIPAEACVLIEKMYGPVSSALERTAESSGASVVVVASHGKGWFKKLWAGSVSEEMSKDAHRAVIVLHGSPSGLQPDPKPTAAGQRSDKDGSASAAAKKTE